MGGGRQWWAAVVSAAAIVAAATALLTVRGTSLVQSVVSEPDLGRFPSRFVTAEYHPDRVVVRSTRDGRIIRVLAEGPDKAAKVHWVVVSPDGSTVYFDRFRPLVCDGKVRDQGWGEIVRVPIHGGKIEPVDPPARGGYLSVSADGAYLNYMTDDAGTGCGDTSRIAQRNLRTGEVRTLNDSRTDGVALRDTAWSPDGSRLVAQGHLTKDGVPRLFRVDLDAREPRFTILPLKYRFAQGVFIADDTIAGTYQDAAGLHIASFDLYGRFQRILFDDAGFLRADPSGNVLMWEPGTRELDGRVFAWNASAGLRTITRADIHDLAWVPDVPALNAD